MRSFPTSIWRQLNRLMDEGVFTFVAAIELRDETAFYLARNDSAIVHRGRTWSPFPMTIDEIQDSGGGDMVRTTLTVSNVGRVAMPYLEAELYDQAKVVIILVYVPDPTIDVGFELEYRIQSAVANSKAVTLSIGPPNFFDRPFPGRRFLRSDGFPNIPKNPQ